jgi:hypothetical protein
MIGIIEGWVVGFRGGLSGLASLRSIRGGDYER